VEADGAGAGGSLGGDGFVLGHGGDIAHERRFFERRGG
jgi:hypothetical protein